MYCRLKSPHYSHLITNNFNSFLFSWPAQTDYLLKNKIHIHEENENQNDTMVEFYISPD